MTKEIGDPDFIAWRKIPGVSERYEASYEGQIRRIYKNNAKPRILTPYRRKYTRCDNNHKPYMIKVATDNGYREVFLHRLIWKAFRGEIPEGMCVVHRNGIKSDNSLPNLMLIPREELGHKYAKMSKGKTILKIDRQGNVVDIYLSTREAERKDFISRQSVSDRLNLKVKNPFELNGHTYIYDNKHAVNKAEKRLGIKIDYDVF